MADFESAQAPLEATTFAPAPPRPAVPGLWVVLGVLVLTIMGWLAWRAMHPPTGPKRQEERVAVHTAVVTEQTVPVVAVGVGTVQPSMTVAVHTRVDGQLQHVAFQEGKDVKAGQLLAVIDSRTFRAQYDQSLAQKAKDQSQLENARLDLARYQQLMKQGATTAQTLDTQRSAVAQLQAAIQNDDAQIEFALVNLDYTSITAPISGRAGAQLVDEGNIVHAGDPGALVVINKIDPIDLQFTLPDSFFSAINEATHSNAHPLVVQAIERGSQKVLATGALVFVNNQIDSSTGTIALKAEFDNPQQRLWPGQSVDARLILGERKRALTVPAPVVQRGPEGLYAYVVDADARVTLTPIEVDANDSRGATAVITRGLSAGQKVVVQGQLRLTPTSRVVEVGAQSGNGPEGEERQGNNDPKGAGALGKGMRGPTQGSEPSASGGSKAGALSNEGPIEGPNEGSKKEPKNGHNEGPADGAGGTR